MLEQIKAIGREAGKKIMAIYDTDMGISLKSDHSPLTLADKASHEYIVETLAAAFPGIPVVSEEGRLPSYAERASYGYFWLVDPLDGTKEFIKKNGEFTVNIALIEDGLPQVGIVYIPAQQRMFSAARGEGAWLSLPGGQQRLAAKQDFDPSGLVASISRSHPSGALDAYLKKIEGVQTVGVGSSLKFCGLAEQKVDFYPRFGPLWEWDTAAAHLVAEESGAAVRQLDGSPLAYNKEVLKHEKGFIAASSERLLDYLFKLI